MFKNLLVIGVLLTFVVACSAWFWPFTTETPAVFQHENVLSLTKENFEELVSFLRYVCFPPKDYSKAEATLFWDEGNKPSALMTLSIRVLKEDGKYYFVKFFANWCGHCKTLAPTWGRLAAENNNTDIAFLQVECGSNKALCDKAAVKGFPEIKVFYNGHIGLSMRGARDLDGMREFVASALPTVQDNYKKAIAKAEAATASSSESRSESSKRGASDDL